ncbi:Uncharacterised protein [Yersinia rohdei]|uniref:Uncharacterized protein n=1 Tax=Yersinia rohdei TaxID=29485 RepID=A0A0U1HXK5_YERRO|nr:Uncharacterised protein [Yersinia rohdei]CQI96529.1 Uncharacterised protein [Yersinia rohdei]
MAQYQDFNCFKNQLRDLRHIRSLCENNGVCCKHIDSTISALEETLN